MYAVLALRWQWHVEHRSIIASGRVQVAIDYLAPTHPWCRSTVRKSRPAQTKVERCDPATTSLRLEPPFAELNLNREKYWLSRSFERKTGAPNENYPFKPSNRLDRAGSLDYLQVYRRREIPNSSPNQWALRWMAWERSPPMDSNKNWHTEFSEIAALGWLISTSFNSSFSNILPE